MNELHPSKVILDLQALRHNIRLVRARIGGAVRFYAVCKGDAYGCGAPVVARVCAEEGVDALCVGDAADAQSIRAAGVTLPILAYGCSDPASAAAMVKLGIIVTIFDLQGLRGFGEAGAPVEAFLELDCGFGRLGFTPDQFASALSELRRYQNIKLRGLYTHLGAVDDAAAVARQMKHFDDLARQARAAGHLELELMVASSRVVANYPDLDLNAVNPGRAIYGMLEGRYAETLAVRPVIRGVESRVIQVKDLASDMRMGYGGFDPKPGQTIRAAVLPIGFSGGFPRLLKNGYVLLHGKRAPIIGLMSMEHTLVDVSDVPEVRHSDTAVLLGEQNGAAITAADLARMTGFEVIDILPRIARGLPRSYV